VTFAHKVQLFACCLVTKHGQHSSQEHELVSADDKGAPAVLCGLGERNVFGFEASGLSGKIS
jgi:hypothetical protein